MRPSIVEKLAPCARELYSSRHRSSFACWPLFEDTSTLERSQRAASCVSILFFAWFPPHSTPPPVAWPSPAPSSSSRTSTTSVPCSSLPRRPSASSAAAAARAPPPASVAPLFVVVVGSCEKVVPILERRNVRGEEDALQKLPTASLPLCLSLCVARRRRETERQGERQQRVVRRLPPYNSRHLDAQRTRVLECSVCDCVIV